LISYSTLQHPLVGDLLPVADEHRLMRSSYLDSKLAPKPTEGWICESDPVSVGKGDFAVESVFSMEA
jgi:hypothetical protein